LIYWPANQLANKPVLTNPPSTLTKISQLIECINLNKKACCITAAGFFTDLNTVMTQYGMGGGE
jgi:hypothetical protein